jgi:hypothetical protein
MNIMQQCYKDKRRFEYILYNKTGSICKKKNSALTLHQKTMEVVVVMPLH